MKKVRCDVFQCDKQADTGVYYKKSGNITCKFCQEHKTEMVKSLDFNPKTHILRTRKFGKEGLNWRKINL